MKKKCLLRKRILTQPLIPDFLAEVDLPRAHPMDSADTLRLKGSIVLESYFKDSITRERDTWLDITQSLAQGVRQRDCNTRGSQYAARPVRFKQ